MAILKVDNLCKSFGKTEVLKGVSFSMNEGEVLSIIGASGSGKTTLLRCINALETATSGKITIGDETFFDSDALQNRTKETDRRWQLSCGLVFQSYNLFPQYTALENVMLAPKLLAKERPDYKENKKAILDEIRETALSLLDRVGLSAVHCSPTRNAGEYLEALQLLLGVLLPIRWIIRKYRTRSYQRHFAFDYVYKLRQLVNTCRTDEFTDLGNALVALEAINSAFLLLCTDTH